MSVDYFTLAFTSWPTFMAPQGIQYARHYSATDEQKNNFVMRSENKRQAWQNRLFNTNCLVFRKLLYQLCLLWCACNLAHFAKWFEHVAVILNSIRKPVGHNPRVRSSNTGSWVELNKVAVSEVKPNLPLTQWTAMATRYNVSDTLKYKNLGCSVSPGCVTRQESIKRCLLNWKVFV